LSDVELYVTDLLKNAESRGFAYHNLSHTKEVVDAVRLIGTNSGLSDDDLESVLLAAWFHDIGYLMNYSGHETESIRITREFLTLHGVDEKRLNTILACIEATRIPQSPKNKLEEVICDADMYHLSHDNHLGRSLMLRKERNTFMLKKTGMTRFMKESLQNLLRPYFTEYARQHLAEGTERNAQLTLKMLEERKAEKKREAGDRRNEKGEWKKVNPEKRDFPARGVETMFRVTANKQTNLNSMADNKSHNLITLTTLMISVIATLIISKYRDFPYLLIPAIILLLSSFLTLLFAILATRPRIYNDKITEEDVRGKKVNLLFFGSFFRMTLDDYIRSMRKKMEDYDQVYNMMIMDQYFTGVVLAKKYQLIRIAYLVFILGFLLALIAFGYSMMRYA
jgi:predicted metal-dependent HD superfamily phosphohydrolase